MSYFEFNHAVLKLLTEIAPCTLLIHVINLKYIQTTSQLWFYMIIMVYYIALYHI